MTCKKLHNLPTANAELYFYSDIHSYGRRRLIKQRDNFVRSEVLIITVWNTSIWNDATVWWNITKVL
jgi:calcineurin-like phosphoesterase family protein